MTFINRHLKIEIPEKTSKYIYYKSLH